MENSQEMPLLEWQQLPIPPPLDAGLLNQLDTNIKGAPWMNSYQCITMIRAILKSHPQLTMDVLGRYAPAVQDHFNNGRAQILRNIFKLLKQIFLNGKNVTVQPVIAFFLPSLMKKAATEKGHIKELSQEILTIVAMNCGYSATLAGVSELSCDKNTLIAELAVKMLQVLVQNMGAAIMQMPPPTLALLMKALACLTLGKRNNMKTSALDICMLLYAALLPDNFLQLMNFALPPHEVIAVGQAMETHRTQKGKPLPLAEALKVRKSQMGINEIHDYNNQQYMQYQTYSN